MGVMNKKRGYIDIKDEVYLRRMELIQDGPINVESFTFQRIGNIFKVT